MFREKNRDTQIEFSNLTDIDQKTDVYQKKNELTKSTSKNYCQNTSSQDHPHGKRNPYRIEF